MNDIRKIRLFLSSPSDVDLERRHVREVVAELNATAARELGVVLEVVGWETDVHPAAGRPQTTITRQVGSYDVFVGIMWRRYGTPTGDSGSGTEEEFLDAYEQWRARGSPKLMFYFCEAPAPDHGSDDDAAQFARVTQFRHRLESDLPLLYHCYRDRTRFDGTFRPHLYSLLVKEFVDGPPLDPRVLDVLELQKEQSQRRDTPFLTPNLLLALLQIKGGFAERGFDGIRPGLAAELRQRFARYVASDEARAGGGYSDFRWRDRPEIREAQRSAADAGLALTGDRQLLLSVLASDGNTIAGLRQLLGEDFERLVAYIESLPSIGVADVARTYNPFGDEPWT